MRLFKFSTSSSGCKLSGVGGVGTAVELLGGPSVGGDGGCSSVVLVVFCVVSMSFKVVVSVVFGVVVVSVTFSLLSFVVDSVVDDVVVVVVVSSVLTVVDGVCVVSSMMVVVSFSVVTVALVVDCSVVVCIDVLLDASLSKNSSLHSN